MPSTLRHTPASAAHALLLLTLSATSALAQGSIDGMTYVGCFSSSAPLDAQGSYKYQSTGWCRPLCQKTNAAVFGLSDGSDCWCGNELPAASSKVSDSSCDVGCTGYGTQMCGGDGFYSVYTVEEGADVPSYGGSSSGSSSSADSSATSTTTSATSATSAASTPSTTTTRGPATTAKPSVVTSIAPGTTVVQTIAAQSESSSSTANSSSSKKSGGSTNVAGIAAGVVVGVLALAAIAAGIFFFLRHKRRREAEDEYKRTQVSDFMRGGERKPPSTGYSQMSDSRLDPEAGARRNSHGSIADNQDYSRRILRVANPT